MAVADSESRYLVFVGLLMIISREPGASKGERSERTK